jgi:hypothetical protein
VDKVAILPIQDRRDLFKETAARRRLPAALIEKDFWVCWTLLQLYTIPAFTGHIVFKGGTSLSKVFGAIPRGEYDICPFAAEEFPDVFSRKTARLEAIVAERTFWEKATILHAEYHRPIDKPMPGRHSRHYYDLAMLAGTDIRGRALADADLRARVVRHKMEFYYSSWARFELAAPGTLHLAPKQERIENLARDYAGMGVMLFGAPPPFDSILRSLADLEAEINNAPRPTST